MVHIITEIHVREFQNNPYAADINVAGKFVPEKGDRLVLRTPSKGGPYATSYTVTSVAALSSYDGYVVPISIPKFDDADAEKRLRKELEDLDWRFITPTTHYPAAI